MYKPNPICTDGVELGDEILELAELIAKNTHDVWAESRIADGWSFGKARDDEKKKHPCLIPYEELPESEIERKGSFTTPSRYGSYGSGTYGSRSYGDDGYSGGYGGYQPAPTRTSFSSTPSVTPRASAPIIDLNKGDMVQHTAFGKGLVLSVMKMGGDALLEIAFDQIGTKKLMAKTASAHLKKL